MARLLTAQTIAVLHHIFKYIFIADLGLLVMKSNFVACLVQTNIGHDGGNDHIILELSDLFEIFTTHIEDQVSIDHISIFIYCQAAVCVSVISESYIQSFFFYKCLQSLDMGGSAVTVDVGSVRFVFDSSNGTVGKYF